MGRTFHILTIFAGCALSAAIYGQGGGGFGGGFGGGGFGQGAGSGSNVTYADAVRAIDSAVNSYLDTNEIRNILTTGEISQWTIDMKAGQVLIADAKSDAFDPALQVIFLEEDEDEEAEGSVLAENDDRFPGDQRPLLIWRCEKDGEYKLRARCFRDKSGGQFFLRMKIYDSLDLVSDEPVEKKLDGQKTLLLRIPMKAGQIKKVTIERPNLDKEYAWANIWGVISPTGLPDIMLATPLKYVIGDAIMAAVDGDYYVLVSPNGPSDGKLRARVQEIVEVPVSRIDGEYTATATRNTLTLWTLDVKKGDVLQVSTPELSLNSRFVLADQPDISEYDLQENANNPFFPRSAGDDDDGQAFRRLVGRARDPRITVFVMRRDATIWLASNGLGGKNETYGLSVTPAAREFTAVSEREGQLRIGCTDYWAFDAEVGDVMTFKSKAKGFAERVIVYDPDLNVSLRNSARIDETEIDWSLIVEKPGRYLVAVSAIGDGGSGSYTLERHVFGAKEFGKGSPASGNFSSGRAEVWKFTAMPDEPLLVHWRSSNWSYTISIRDEKGVEISLPLTTVDSNNMYGVLKVKEQTTYLIVLVSNGSRTEYSITLRDLPGS